MTEARCAGDDEHADRSYVLSEITRRIIQLHKQYFGKGPTKGRTYWHEDVITVVLQGGFTPAEQTLRETGHAEAVAEQRTMMHEGLREHFKREIGELTGREVIGFMSGIQQDPDMAAEVFVLAPERFRSGPSRSTLCTTSAPTRSARLASTPPTATSIGR